MDAIGACFVGGASAYGGVGTVPGVIVGAVLMGVINLGMSIMGVDANYQKGCKRSCTSCSCYLRCRNKETG